MRSDDVRCDEVAEVLPGVIDGTHRADRRMRRHVESCLRCQAELVQYRKLLRVLHTLRTDVLEPNPGVLSSILANLEEAGERGAIRSLVAGRKAAYLGGLAVATAAAGAILIGTVIGALAGFYRGLVDDALMRFTDAAQTVPNFLLALALIAVLGPATWSVVAAIALVSWPGTARIVRAEFLSLREREFVLAARAMGMGDGRLIFGQMLPNVASSIVVLATVVVSVAILVVGLSHGARRTLALA